MKTYMWPCILQSRQFDIDKLRVHDIAETFEQTLGGRFKPLLDIEEDIASLYNKFKSTTNEVTHEIVGYRKRKQVEGMSKDLIDMCEERRIVRKEFLKKPTLNAVRERYRKLNKDVKRLVTSAKRQKLKKKIEKMEADFRANNSHNLFKEVRELEGRPKKSLSVVKDRSGRKCIKPKEVLECWKYHFQNPLNTAFPYEQQALEGITLPNIPSEIFENFSIEEIRKAVSQMKLRKTPDYDNISTEALKAGGEPMVAMMHKISTLAIRHKRTPKDWLRMIVTPIHKKGDKLNPANYRAIALLSIPGKVFSKALLNRIQKETEKILGETQYGFRPGRGTTDAIFIVRQIMEKARERKIPLHLYFIDFKSAFDTIWRKSLWRMMKWIGISANIVDTVEYMYDQTECAVIIDNHLTEWFLVTVGVRQGCLLSPTLCNIFLEFVMDELSNRQKELQLDDRLSIGIRYADDTTLVAVIFDLLRISTNELEQACAKWGMKINAKKCKMISPSLDNLTINGSNVDKIEEFTFLGSVVPGSYSDVNRRIALASSAFGRLKGNVWRRKDLSNSLKLRLYNALIVPIASYASETWTLKEEDLRKLAVF